MQVTSSSRWPAWTATDSSWQSEHRASASAAKPNPASAVWQATHVTASSVGAPSSPTLPNHPPWASCPGCGVEWHETHDSLAADSG